MHEYSGCVAMAPGRSTSRCVLPSPHRASLGQINTSSRRCPRYEEKGKCLVCEHVNPLCELAGRFGGAFFNSVLLRAYTP